MIALVVEAALRSLALGLVVWLAMQALRPRNPHLHKTVWITVLLASIAMPFVIQWQVAPSFDAPGYLLTLVQVDGGMGSVAGESGPALSAPGALPAGAITVVYALVTFALLTRFALGLFSLWRIRRSATPLARRSSYICDDAFDTRVSPRMSSPATFGSTILLPANASEWSEDKLAAVLSHERSHVRYKDCYVQWLAHLHACFFWFNPLAWWLNRRLAELAETTSDDAVIEALPDRTAYADLLLEIARNPSAGRVVMSAARPNISARIERIISNVPPSSPPRRWVRALAVAVLIPAFTMAAATLERPPGATAVPAPAPTAAANDDPMKPKLIYAGDGDLLERYYPAEAKRHGIDGRVSISLTIDTEGRVTDTLILDVFPNDREWGLGAAASALVHNFRFSNPTGRTTQTTLQVKFELRKGPAELLPPGPAKLVPGADASSPAAHSP